MPASHKKRGGGRGGGGLRGKVRGNGSKRGGYKGRYKKSRNTGLNSNQLPDFTTGNNGDFDQLDDFSGTPDLFIPRSMKQESMNTRKNRERSLGGKIRNKPPIQFVKSKEVYDPSKLLNLRIKEMERRKEAVKEDNQESEDPFSRKQEMADEIMIDIDDDEGDEMDDSDENLAEKRLEEFIEEPLKNADYVPDDAIEVDEIVEQSGVEAEGKGKENLGDERNDGSVLITESVSISGAKDSPIVIPDTLPIKEPDAISSLESDEAPSIRSEEQSALEDEEVAAEINDEIEEYAQFEDIEEDSSDHIIYQRSDSEESTFENEDFFVLDTVGDGNVPATVKSVSEIMHDLKLSKAAQDAERREQEERGFMELERQLIEREPRRTAIEKSAILVGGIMIEDDYVELHTKSRGSKMKFDDFDLDSDDDYDEYDPDDIEDDVTIEQFMSFGKSMKRQELPMPTMLIKTKGKGKNRKPVLNNTDIFYEDMMEAYLARRLSKADKRKAKEATPISLGDKYPYSLHIKEIKQEIELFFNNQEKSALQFPPLDSHGLSTVEKMGGCFGLKSRRLGQGNSKHIVLIKNKRTYRTMPDFTRVNRLLRQQPVFPRMDRKKPRDENWSDINSAKKKKGPKEAFHVREGEIVGEKAPELGQENLGRRMLEKLGWKAGQGLGTEQNKGIATPVAVTVKKSKLGIRTMSEVLEIKDRGKY